MVAESTGGQVDNASGPLLERRRQKVPVENADPPLAALDSTAHIKVEGWSHQPFG
jgi:hypothetical protein